MDLKLECNRLLLDRLEYLKQLFDVDSKIELVYLPGQNEDSLKQGCRGRVEGSTIYIFEDDHERALETLTHEFMHYLLNESRNASIRVHNSNLALMSSILESYRKITERSLNDAEERGIEKLCRGLTNLLQ